MFRRPRRTLLAALLVSLLSLLWAFASWAGASHEGSAFLPSTVDPAVPIVDALVPIPTLAGGDRMPASGATIASEFVVVPPGARSAHHAAPEPPTVYASHYVSPPPYESVSYQPRRSSYHGVSQWHPVTQLHAGFLDPDGPATSGFDLGFRGGHEIDQIFQIGVGLDWRTKSGGQEQLLQSSVGPGGQAIQTQLPISHFSSNLLPVMAYFQLSGPTRRITPYVGIAGTWEVLFLQADDYTTGQRFDATYNGFGWQAWGGVGLRLAGRTKLVAEVFMNQATLGRDLYDPYYGLPVRETISADGIGARYGVSWSF